MFFLPIKMFYICKKNMNPIRQVVLMSKSSQKDVCDKMNINQSTLSRRMLNEVKGSIDWSIEVAKYTGVNSYTIVGEGYELRVKIKNR